MIYVVCICPCATMLWHVCVLKWRNGGFFFFVPFFLSLDTAGDGYVLVNGIEVYNTCPDTTVL